MKVFKKALLTLLLILSFFLISCNEENNIIEGECEIVYEYNNEYICITEFDLSLIKIKIDDGNEVHYVEVTENMISDSDLDKLSEIGIHNIAIVYGSFIGEATVILTDEFGSIGIEYSIYNPYEGRSIDIDDFNLADIQIVINNKGILTYESVSSDMLSAADISKLNTAGQHNISVNYANNVFNISITLKATVVLDEYTYDVENTRSKLKISELNKVYEDQEYTNYLDVASYIYHFHKLPKNYLTKKQAEDLGWNGSGNDVWANSSLYGKLIGGDTFYNNEGSLPSVIGYAYVEVDVDCYNGRRGSHRLVYNKVTWDIYYTTNHYDSFVYLIGRSK